MEDHKLEDVYIKMFYDIDKDYEYLTQSLENLGFNQQNGIWVLDLNDDISITYDYCEYCIFNQYSDSTVELNVHSVDELRYFLNYIRLY